MSQSTAFWRLAGLSYLQYTQVSAGAVRNALKEPMRSAVAARTETHFRERVWTNGVAQDRVVVKDIFQKPVNAQK